MGRAMLLRLLRDTGGSAALEAAIILPLALLLMAGGIEFGRLASSYMTADKAMRNAARYLAGVPDAHVNGWGLTNAQNLAIYGNTAGTGPPVLHDWAPGNITCPTCADVAAKATEVVRLQGTFTFQPVIGLSGLPASFNINVRHEERFTGPVCNPTC